jgi:tetratricopeptide (TPR) repeat protein
LKYNYLWFVDHEYSKKKYEKAYEYLMMMKQDLSIYDSEIVNFTFWLKMIEIAHYVNKQDGINAIEELKNRNNLITNISYYDESKVINKIKKILDPEEKLSPICELECARKERIQENYDKAYEYLLRILNKSQISVNDQHISKLYNFDLWDELGIVTYYISKKDQGRIAFNKLIELAEANVPETIENLKCHGNRILKNMCFYDCPELVKKFSKILENIN